MATVDAAVADGLSMKLQIVVDKKKNRVIFAEANKEFVDFIFHILSLTLGTVQKILTETSASFGSIGKLYDGLKKLDTKYMEVAAKDYLLYGKAPYSGENNTLLLPEASLSKPKEFYLCSHNKTVRVGEHACRQGSENGYVKELVMFMVMDDLVVRPAEPSSVFSMINEHSIKDVGNIEKREVTFSIADAKKLLKASVSSKTVLTDVFLRGAVKAEN